MARKKPLPDPGPWKFQPGQLVRHQKTGNVYYIRAHVIREADLSYEYVYRAIPKMGETPPSWVRPKAEMEDGRFVLDGRVFADERGIPEHTITAHQGSQRLREAPKRPGQGLGRVRPADAVSKAGKPPEWVRAGLRLKQARRKAGLVQWKLGKLIGHSRSHISHMEQGLVNPKHKDMQRAWRVCRDYPHHGAYTP